MKTIRVDHKTFTYNGYTFINDNRSQFWDVTLNGDEIGYFILKEDHLGYYCEDSCPEDSRCVNFCDVEEKFLPHAFGKWILRFESKQLSPELDIFNEYPVQVINKLSKEIEKFGRVDMTLEGFYSHLYGNLSGIDYNNLAVYVHGADIARKVKSIVRENVDCFGAFCNVEIIEC